jgi:hypothetical protein
VASAATLPRVSVEGCPPSLSRGLEGFVAIELEPLSEGTSEIDVQVGCGADTVVLLVSVDGQAQTRSMDLRTIAPSVRARVVALTVAELVRELRALPPPQPAPPSPAPVDRPTPAAPQRRTVGELEAFFQSTQFDLDGGVLIGGGLRFAYTGLKPWRLALDFGASTYRRVSELGSARLILAGLGARVGRALPVGELWLELGAGGRAGVARISGSAANDQASAASVAGAWSAPFVFLGLDAPVGGSWRLGLDAELGYVLSPVRGRVEGGEDVEVDELWTSLGLGLAVEL